MTAPDDPRADPPRAAVAPPTPPPAPTLGATARRTLVGASVVAAVAVGLLFLWHARDVLLLVFAGVLFGIFLRRLAMLLGVTLATPLAAAVVVLVTMLYVQDVLGRRDIRVRSH